MLRCRIISEASLSITMSIRRPLSTLKEAPLSTWWRIDIRFFSVRGELVYQGLVLADLRARSVTTQSRMLRVSVRRIAAGASRCQGISPSPESAVPWIQTPTLGGPWTSQRVSPSRRWQMVPIGLFAGPWRNLSSPSQVGRRAPRWCRVGELLFQRRDVLVISYPIQRFLKSVLGFAGV